MPDGTKAAPRALREYFTKSRFALALECPTKLYYAGKQQYVNAKVSDEFLIALAKGGFQVAALARAMEPNGEWIADRTPAEQVAKTRSLLSRDEVTLFEATVASQGLLARIDILRKIGRRIELCEVKAKSYDAAVDRDFLTTKGAIISDYLPYLQDVAFQRLVFERAYPDFEVSCFLILVDKASCTTIEGLNQRFKVRRSNGSFETIVAPGTNASTIGGSILARINVDARISEILSGPLPVNGATLPFPEAVGHLADAYHSDTRIGPHVGGQCAKCDFRPTSPIASDQRSGFHECWSTAFGWTGEDFADGLVLDLCHVPSAKKTQLINSGIRKLKQVTPNHINVRAAEDGLSRTERQWMQASGQWDGGGPFYLDRARMRAAMASWQFPLHFIDFETAMFAVPFTKARRPYGQIAFQFSHHMLHKDGRLEHRSQYLNATPGVFPNCEFLRQLRAALQPMPGTIFRWAAHENTVLNALRDQLMEEEPHQADRDELIDFIHSVTTPIKSEQDREPGPRAMVDLCRLAEIYFFHPDTSGSSSLKKVLPALMKSSPVLQQIYGSASYGGPHGFHSKNFVEPMTWWKRTDGSVIDPYDLLPPIFDDVDHEQQKALDNDEQTNVQDGGAAMMAYARLQLEDLSAERRKRIEDALYRYCELDTLAMVMVVQAWQAEL